MTSAQPSWGVECGASVRITYLFHLLGSASLGRILLVIDGELGCTLTPLGLGDDVHNHGDMETASEPGRLGCDRVS